MKLENEINQFHLMLFVCFSFHLKIIFFENEFILDKPIFVDVNGNQMNNSSVILVNEGESVKLECLVDSSPSSLISWIFNGQILSTNQKIYFNR